ncbi:MAG: VCBS repeat-containing protein, partial [Betaproteobacteria bacterium]|nr:VCBS repeat-containing protein [Betaproteobacteria bacterium]
LLVGPDGKKITLLSDVGGAADLINVNLTLVPSGAPSLPDSTAIVSGTYVSTNIGAGDFFAAPAPAGPYNDTLASYVGVAASTLNGTWSLYIVDDLGGDSGSLSGGWAIDVTTIQGQTISFPGIASKTLGDAPFSITATGGASGNPVLFSSITPTVCAASSTSATSATITLIAAGTCTIAANQAGNSSYQPAAQVSQSFSVIMLTPNAVQNLACNGEGAQVSCSFDPPLPNNTAPVLDYRLSCSRFTGGDSVGSVIGATSPLSLTSVPTGIGLRCTVTARNEAGNGLEANVFVIALSNLSRNVGIDMNGDGRGELFVRNNDTGLILLGGYNSNNQQIEFRSIENPGANTRMLGVGDFYIPGFSDLLFQNLELNTIDYWVSFDGFVDSRFTIATPPLGAVVEAVADLDGDNHSDIIWRQTETGDYPIGQIFAWFIGANGVVGEVKVRGSAPLNWALVGAADLGNDGLKDIIALSPTGEIRTLISLAQRNFSNQRIGQQPAGYTLTRLADLNGDGKADLIFRDAQGRIKVWVMDGITIQAQIDLPQSEASCELFAVTDLNGDGAWDLVFKKPDNTLVLWLTNPAQLAQPTVIDNAGLVPVGYINIDP